jgi:trehalose 2-sulfotransferase
MTKILFLSTPRSGSTHIVRTLAQRYDCGAPEEYLSPKLILDSGGRENPQLFSQHLAGVRTEFAHNPNFSIKIMIRQLMFWRKRGFDPLSMGFDELVWIERRDKIAQATSLAMARKTDQWVVTQNDTDVFRSDTLTKAEVAKALLEISIWHEYAEVIISQKQLRVLYFEDVLSNPELLNDFADELHLEKRSILGDQSYLPLKQHSRAKSESEASFRSFLGLS